MARVSPDREFVQSARGNVGTALALLLGWPIAALVTLLPSAITNAVDAPSVVANALLVLPLLVLLAYPVVVVRSLRRGIVATNSALTVRSTWRTRTIPWDEIVQLQPDSIDTDLSAELKRECMTHDGVSIVTTAGSRSVRAGNAGRGRSANGRSASTSAAELSVIKTCLTDAHVIALVQRLATWAPADHPVSHQPAAERQELSRSMGAAPTGPFVERRNRPTNILIACGVVAPWIFVCVASIAVTAGFDLPVVAAVITCASAAIPTTWLVTRAMRSCVSLSDDGFCVQGITSKVAGRWQDVVSVGITQSSWRYPFAKAAHAPFVLLSDGRQLTFASWSSFSKSDADEATREVELLWQRCKQKSIG